MGYAHPPNLVEPSLASVELPCLPSLPYPYLKLINQLGSPLQPTHLLSKTLGSNPVSPNDSSNTPHLLYGESCWLNFLIMLTLG